MNKEDELLKGTGPGSPDTFTKESTEGLRVIRGNHKRKKTVLIKQMRELDTACSLTPSLNKSLINQISRRKLTWQNPMKNNIQRT